MAAGAGSTRYTGTPDDETGHVATGQEPAETTTEQQDTSGDAPDAAEPDQSAARANERIGSAGGDPYPAATPEHEQTEQS